MICWSVSYTHLMNQTELQRVGNINPDGVGGLFSSFSYKNIFLDFSIDFRIGCLLYTSIRFSGTYRCKQSLYPR